jgi:hypothetical protein
MNLQDLSTSRAPTTKEFWRYEKGRKSLFSLLLRFQLILDV